MDFGMPRFWSPVYPSGPSKCVRACLDFRLWKIALLKSVFLWFCPSICHQWVNQCSRNTDFESEKINNVRLCLRGGRLPSRESVVIHYCAAHPLLSQITTSRALSSCHCSVKGSLANIIVLRWVLLDSAWQSSVLETVGFNHGVCFDCRRGKRPAVPSSLSLSSTWLSCLLLGTGSNFLNPRLFGGNFEWQFDWCHNLMQSKGCDSTGRT